MRKEGKEVLVVIHPGSACGSADFTLGHIEGAEARHALCKTIHGWLGPCIVIDNDLSSELSVYAQIGLAIDSLPEPARIHACSSKKEWLDQAYESLPEGSDKLFLLTGAWHHPEEGSGCIDAIACRMEKEGRQWKILPCALRL